MPRKKKKDRDGLYERKDRPGQFWGSWIDATGRRRQRKLNASTSTQAKLLLEAEKRKVDYQRTTGIVPPSEESFADFIAEFLSYQKRRISSKVVRGKLSQVEYERQKGIVEKHLRPFFGAMKLKTIRRKDVAAYINSRMGEVGDGTIIKEVNTLKRMFNIASRERRLR